MSDAQNWIEWLLNVNEQLLGLPALPLIIILGVALGYAIKGFPKIDNRFIPLIVMVSCSVCYVLICLAQIPVTFRTVEVISAVTRYFVLGLIGGAMAWLLHAKLLKRFDDDTENPPK